MRLLAILLVPMLVVAKPIDLTVNKFILTIDDDILKGIQTTDELSYDLNLAGLGIHGIAFDTVFENVSHVKNLSLANNSISSLPESAFASLKDLKHLSLADNEMADLGYDVFLGLDNLVSLNISNNPITDLELSDFYGLNKHANVITLGNNFCGLHLSHWTAKRAPVICIDHGSSRKFQLLSLISRYNLCIRDGVVEKLELFVNSSDRELHCRNFVLGPRPAAIDLSQSGISTFSTGWYRLQNYSVLSLDLRDNNIVNISSEFLNDLPAEINYVDFSNNKIERLATGSIVNVHLRTLNFKGNFISDIEENALSNTELTDLILTGNRLKNTFFVRTLPPTLTGLWLDDNQIAELSPESFLGLGKLRTLTIAQNNITEIEFESLRGLIALEVLNLTENHIKSIEKKSFQDLKSLKTLNLKRNNLTSLVVDTFDGLKSVTVIDLSSNSLTKITNDSLRGLFDLTDLHLSFNQIETLRAGTFATVPRSILSLDNNRIKEIENGTFRLHSSDRLYQRTNSSGQLDDESPHQSEKSNLKNENVVNKSNEILLDPSGEFGCDGVFNAMKEPAEKRIRVKEHSKMSNFIGTSTDEMEDRVVGNTELETLILTRNRLNNTMFVATLPPSLTKLKLNENQIDELSSGSFSRLNDLVTLDLNDNNISEVSNNSLRGLFSVEMLGLNRNNIRNIENGSFKDLESLRTLSLERNELTYLSEGIFDGLKHVRVLNLNWNNLREIAHRSFRGLRSLKELHLSFNRIRVLKADTFLETPGSLVSRASAKIKPIKNKTVHSNSSECLWSPANLLTGGWDNEYSVELAGLRYLVLHNNNITEIAKGAVKHLTKLESLDVSSNPIRKLENGALFVENRAHESFVINLANVPIELIQAGVFDDL